MSPAGERGTGGPGGGLTEIFEVHSEPVVDRPVLVVALEGWVDAGLGATTAIAALLGQSRSEPVVTFNGEHFLDQRARRPVARIVNGITTDLTLAPHRRAPGVPTTPGTTSSSWWVPSPTSTGAPSPTPWSGWPVPGACAWWSDWAPSRPRRPTPGRSSSRQRRPRARPTWWSESASSKASSRCRRG